MALGSRDNIRQDWEEMMQSMIVPFLQHTWSSPVMQAPTTERGSPSSCPQYRIKLIIIIITSLVIIVKIDNLKAPLAAEPVKARFIHA